MPTYSIFFFCHSFSIAIVRTEANYIFLLIAEYSAECAHRSGETNQSITRQTKEIQLHFSRLWKINVITSFLKAHATMK